MPVLVEAPHKFLRMQRLGLHLLHMLVKDSVWRAELPAWDRQDRAHRPPLAVLPVGSVHTSKGAKALLTKVKMNA